jgi:hypothetical protein
MTTIPDIMPSVTTKSLYNSLLSRIGRLHSVALAFVTTESRQRRSKQRVYMEWRAYLRSVSLIVQVSATHNDTFACKFASRQTHVVLVSAQAEAATAVSRQISYDFCQLLPFFNDCQGPLTPHCGTPASIEVALSVRTVDTV